MSVFIDPFPAPYKLSGPTPGAHHPDVRVILDLAKRQNIVTHLEQGLVLRLIGTTQLWFVSFYETNEGEHRFFEMSGEGMLFNRNELPELLHYLGQAGIRYVSPVRLPAPLG